MAHDQTSKRELILRGIPASPGIAIGTAYLFLKEIPRVEERKIEERDVAIEITRLDHAIEKSAKELRKIHVFAQEKIGDAKAKILDAQIMVLEDRILMDSIRRRIKMERRNPEYIVSDEIGRYASLMLRAPDEYMHERAHDMEDLRNRIIRNLQQERLQSKLEGTLIVVAHSLTPADTMILSRNHVLGYATDTGGITSHAALFSRSLKIPAVVGLGDVSRQIGSGDALILDGYSGTIVIHPTKRRIQEYEQKRERFQKFEAKLAQLKDLPAQTTDGHALELSANIELPDELDYVVLQGSQGVGLYRTESLLIGKDEFPTEEEQYQEYRKIAARIYPHRVIVRTFDIGGDKVAPEAAEEANPFLGWRGIRVGLDKPELLLNQLRAMLRASTRRNLAIMFPMVSSITEVRRALEYVRQAKAELHARNARFHDKTPIGVMIEVPSAALDARRIAAEVDFLSIGSNDLTQYLLAVDRTNRLVSRLFRQFDPNLIMTLKHVINAGHKQGIWVGICGEMAGSPLAVPLLVGLGMDELSVIPSVLPEVKKIIRSLDYRKARDLARTVLGMETADEIESYLRRFFRRQFPDIPLDNNT